MNDRMRLLLPGLALAFVLGMALLYFWALGTPSKPAVQTAVGPAVAVQAPVVKPPTRSKPIRRGAPSAGRSSGGFGGSNSLRAEPSDTDGPSEPFAMMEIDGDVIDDSGSSQGGVKVIVSVNGKRSVLKSNSSGHFSAKVPGGRTQVWAERLDGALRTTSDRIEFDSSEGGEWEVELILPSSRRAGLGIRIGSDEDGIRVNRVLKDSPAEELGLKRGDVIIAVDGESAAGMSRTDFVALMTGDEGTRQVFTVRRRDGSEERMVFERTMIKNPPKTQRKR